MTQTYRTDDLARWGTGQGFNLSPAQVDINFWDLVQRMIAQEARPDPSAGIDHFSISGTMMYVHMTDDTVLGPYQLPVAIFRDRGEWAPSTPYSVMDTFSINGGLWVVIFDHTSGATFDEGANDGAGHDYYQLMLQTPGSSLPSGGAPGQLLLKATATDYAVMWGYTDAGNVTFEPATDSALTSDNVADALEEIAATAIATAADIPYEPSTASGLTSDNVQDALDELGELGDGDGIITQNSQNVAYTCVLADAGKHIFHPSSDTTARTWTIPANASVAYTVGTAITFVNQNAAGVITIAITSDTMRLAGVGTTGSRTLAANGIATALKIAAAEWIISGTGIT